MNYEIGDAIARLNADRHRRALIRQEAEQIAREHQRREPIAVAKIAGLALQAAAGDGEGPTRLVQWRTAGSFYQWALPADLADAATSIIAWARE